MYKSNKIFAGFLSFVMLFAFASSSLAGDNHQEKKEYQKAMSGIISVEKTTNGIDYFLTVHPKAKENKTIDIRFSDEVGETRPADGQRVTVRGKYMEDEFVVNSVVIVNKKSIESNM